MIQVEIFKQQSRDIESEKKNKPTNVKKENEDTSMSKVIFIGNTLILFVLKFFLYISHFP